MSNSSTIYVDIVVNDKSATSTIKRATTDIDTLGQKGVKSMNALSTASKGAGTSVGFLGNKIMALGSAYLGAQGLEAVIKLADGYSLVESKLKLVSKGSDDFKNNYEELFRISQDT
jgi:hypothetical protein